MPTIDLKSSSGQAAGSLALPDAVFGAEIRETSVRACYNQFMANHRAGTHSTKTRGEVSGGGKKPWRQKGTGRARAGSSRSPLWRHGAILFGPLPRDYSYRVNKKIRRQAITSLLSDHVKHGTLTAVEKLGLAEPKTKLFLSMMDSLNLGDAERLLVLVEGVEDVALLASRNIPNVQVMRVENVNVYDLLVADRVLATKSALEALGKLHQDKAEDKAA